MPMKSKKMSQLDAMFLYGETRETMMHVAGLLHFSFPENAPSNFLRDLVKELKDSAEIHPPWNMKLKTPQFLYNPVNKWIEDEAFDLDYHIRRSALPSPGDERELGILVSYLHSNQLDFTRPPWELHLIEGMENGKFALYVKVHHALIDGYTSMRILSRSLSSDRHDHEQPMFFSIPPIKRNNQPSDEDPPTFTSMLEHFWEYMGSVQHVGRALIDLRNAGKNEFKNLVSSIQAPNCILNGKIGRNRRFATQQYTIERLKALGRSVGGTLNDVVIAICAGGLRKFLLELGELPEKPLIAFMPVNVRPKDDPGGGNAVGVMLASMATDIKDPAKRIEAIIDSTRKAKEQMHGMSQNAILAYSALLMAPFGFQSIKAIAGISGKIPLTFNVCISNVPGPDSSLFFRGAHLDATYPVSIPVHGMALNITCQSYNGTLNFGFIGCRDTLPHLQRLAVYTGEALEELEKTIHSNG
ncbi:MAG: wax ester/triacylglycerol synthase family O-acyltransferase [SAR324 cluster bacterium]|nr:wax ester/triacylglycerol synthase family O-acyltransferase [SAR324 cluster bacterium]